MDNFVSEFKKIFIYYYVLTYSSDNQIINNINNKLFDILIYLYSIDITDNIDSDAETVPLSDYESDYENNKRKYSDSDDEPLFKKIKYDYDFLLRDLFEKDLDKVLSFTNMICLYRVFFNNEYLYIISPTNNIKERIKSLNEQYNCKGRIIVINIYKNNNFIYPERKYKANRGFYNIDYNIIESLKKNEILFKSNKYIIDNNNNEFWKDKKKMIFLDKDENENNMWKYFYS